MGSTTAVGRSFVDTNVLVYAIDAGEATKRRVSRALLADAGPGDLVISAQVLAEFFVVVTRKLAVPLAEDAAGRVVGELAALEVVPIDADLVISAITLARDVGISYWDAAIVRAATVAACDVVLSEDLAHGREYGALRVVDPFR